MISPLAYVDADAKLGRNVTVHPFAYIDRNVVIGDDCEIKPYASVLGGTRMGKGNVVYQGAIVGATPQDFNFRGEDTVLEIGDNNTIREKAIINRATYPGGKTSIGNGNYLLEGVHVAHDTHVGNECVLGNGAKTAGNCEIYDHAILGSDVILKHGCRVGSWALLRDGCRANKDVPPFIVAAHNPISYYGVNAVLLARQGEFDENVIDDIAKAYRQIYQCGTSLDNALRRIEEVISVGDEIRYLLDFIRASEKGIIGVASV